MKPIAVPDNPKYFSVALALGGVCQVGQVLVLREFLMVFHGNELSFGVVLAAWMLWVGVGSRCSARILERRIGARSVLSACSCLAAVLLPATIIAIRVLRAAFTVTPGTYLSILDMVVSAVAVVAPLCLVLGAIFVAISRLAREAVFSVGTVGAGRTYIGEAIGNSIGGIIFSLLAVRYLGPLTTAVAASIVLAAGAGFAASGDARFRLADRAVAAPAVIAIVLLASTPFLGAVDRYGFDLQWRTFAPAYDLIETRHSRYGAISVAGRDEQVSFFQSGNFVFSSSGNDAETRFEEQDAVVFAHMTMLQHPAPRRVLIIGGGVRGTLREILRHPVESVTYVELDDVLTAAAISHAPEESRAALEDARVRLVHGDGRFFVKRDPATYDVILVDVPDPSTAVLNRFFTQEFFREARARLADGGVFVTALATTADLRGLTTVNQNATVFHTLSSVFARVLATGDRALVFFADDSPDATDGPVSSDPAVLAQRLGERRIAAGDFSRAHIELFLRDDHVRRVNWILRNHGRSQEAHREPPRAPPAMLPSLAEQLAADADAAPVVTRRFINSDMRPIGYFYTLVKWSVLTRADHARYLQRLANIRLSWTIAPFGAAVLGAIALFALGSRRERFAAASARFAVFTAVFTTGISTMSIQIALIFVFQSVYGFVYEMVGVIVAIFMAGLAVGTIVVRARFGETANARMLAAIQLAITVFSLVVAVLLPWTTTIPSPTGAFVVFATITFLAGALNGADFPLAVACRLKARPGTEKATGAVYGTELFGACLGSLIAGVVLAPIFGIVACCIFASLANAAAFLTLVISESSKAGRVYA
ncbi:MAG: spermine synthase [Spirochaetaceae bacterium]|nr:MAG: spermine synthase [Spirochaetaceae bacterium]